MSGDLIAAARGAWAGVSFMGLRAALGRAAEILPPARRLEAQGEPVSPTLTRIEGPLRVDPMSGAIFRGARRLPPPPEAAGGEPRPTDWIVEAFPSRMRYAEVAPVWYGEDPSLAAILTEALPRCLMLDRQEETRDAVALVSLPLGRLDAMQAALSQGVFAPRPVKVHAWDKVIGADRAWRLQAAPGPELLRESARRLSAPFLSDGPAPRSGPPVFLCRGAESVREMRGESGRAGLLRGLSDSGVTILDPDRAALRDVIQRIYAAPAVLAGDSGGVGLLLLAAEGARLGRIGGEETPAQAENVLSALDSRPDAPAIDVASDWLVAGSSA